LIRPGFIRAVALTAIAAISLAGSVRAMTPTLEIHNMTKHPAVVVVDRAGRLYGHYSIASHGKAVIYGEGPFSFTGTVYVSGGNFNLPRREATLKPNAGSRGLIIEQRGNTIDWNFGAAASGAVM
jgi:hypothetical protein